MGITWDKLFSYWAFSWFIIYYFGNKYLEKYTGVKIPSPKLALHLALYENIIELISLITVNLNGWLITKYSLMILFVKVLPLYLIWDVKLEYPRDIYILIGVFIVYVAYLNLIGTSLLEVYKTTNKSLAEGKNDTPFFRFLDWISENR
jgi:hypothetical protein